MIANPKGTLKSTGDTHSVVLALMIVQVVVATPAYIKKYYHPFQPLGFTVHTSVFQEGLKI